MTKTKELKSFTVHTNPNKVKARIADLEADLIHTPRIMNSPSDLNFKKRNQIKEELNYLYRLRKKQKNYIPPPKPLNLKKGL